MMILEPFRAIYPIVNEIISILNHDANSHYPQQNPQIKEEPKIKEPTSGFYIVPHHPLTPHNNPFFNSNINLNQPPPHFEASNHVSPDLFNNMYN